MKTGIVKSGIVLVAMFALLWAEPARAAVIYSNSTNDNMIRFNPGLLEVGDEINLVGSERYLTNFSFEYYGTNTASAFTFAGSPEARIRFYLNDGAPFNGYPTPGSNFYDSGWFSVPSPTERSTFVFEVGLDFSSPGLYMPVISNFTWSVQFTNYGGTDELGVDIYDPPTVGSGYKDYWEFSAGVWTLKTNINPAIKMNFASRFEATVPEPSALALSVLGGLGLLAVARRLRGR